MAEELSRKQRTRGGHKSTATRIITFAIKVLATGDLSEISNAVKLNKQTASFPPTWKFWPLWSKRKSKLK